MDSGGVVCGIGGSRRDLHQRCRVFVRDIRAVLSCILHDCHNISSLSRVRETAGSLENRAISSNLKIVRPHLLTHRWQARSIYENASCHALACKAHGITPTGL